MLVLMDSSTGQHIWPPHQVETVPWQQRMRAGTREDRMLRSVETSVPPLIAALTYVPPAPVLVAAENALVAVVQADAQSQGHSAALSRFMVRTESVASSKIEHISASATDYAKALAGIRSNASATSMVAASTALHGLIDSVSANGRIELSYLLNAHQALMADDPYESAYAGTLRDMQNWIGGSDHSPRDALYVPPPATRLPDLIDDLITYLNRDDVPVMVQAAIGHAQFESIHAFTDGNGRLGRALASGLLARRDDYFDSLAAYRRGDPAPIIELFSHSARAAADCSRITIARLKAMPSQWAAALRPRAGSAAAVLIEAFYDHPIMGSADVEFYSGSAPSQGYRAIDRLVEAGFIQEITGRKRNRVWAASEVLAELDDLDRRIQASMP
jgi:Fic family protein